MNDEGSTKLATAITDNSEQIDGKKRLPCALALKLARDHAVSARDVGRTCDDLGIAVSKCQLGCFD